MTFQVWRRELATDVYHMRRYIDSGWRVIT